jgi:predicted membrane protein
MYGPGPAIFRGFSMIRDKLAQKGSSLTAFFIALVFLVFAFFYIQYRYLHICIAVLAFVYGFRQLKRRDTPFEKRERELRSKNM